jgi:hypothetical protein
MAFDIIDFEKVVPKPLLDFYVEKMELEADRRSIESIFNSLNEKNSTMVNSLYDNYKYAGRTAVNIFEEVTLPSEFLTKEKFEKILIKELGTSKIYNKEFRPPLSEEPQINFVEDRGDSVLVEFVAKGKNRRLRNGYDIIEVASIQFEHAVVHFVGPTIIELRCPYSLHSKFLSCFENYFRNELNESNRIFEWVPITRVSNSEAEKIAKILSAGLVEADHKDDGIFDRHLVTANPDIRDLRTEDEYVQQFKNKMLLSQSLLIDYEDITPYGTYKTTIKFKINLHTGFQFLSKVSESVIDYVMDVFMDVRYNEGKSYENPKSVENQEAAV